MTRKEIKIKGWYFQDEDNLWHSILDWDFHRFVCVMKDNSIQVFTGSADEDSNGEVHKYVKCDNDDYDIDDVIAWMEVPDGIISAQND